jgi:hypothetical protein
MPRYRSSEPVPALPRRTLDYLQHGAPEGERNAELFDAACQFRDAGHGQEDAEAQLIDRALADGLTESEARHTIRSAFTQGAREPAAFGAHRTPAAPVTPATSPQQVPPPIDDGFLRLLDACFADDELVSIAPPPRTTTASGFRAGASPSPRPSGRSARRPRAGSTGCSAPSAASGCG